MRVIHVATSDASIRHLLADQLRYLADRGHEVSAISGPGPWVSEIRDLGIRLDVVSLTRRIDPARDALAFVSLVRILGQRRPDLVHTHTPKAGLLGQWAAFASGVRWRVHTIHGLYFPGHMRVEDRWRYVWLERAQMRPANLLLSQNREDMLTCEREGICDPRRLRYLGNGIDIDFFHPRNQQAEAVARKRNELGIPTGDFVVGMVGRLVAEKGYLEYFEAARRVLDRLPSVSFLAIGEPEAWKPGSQEVTPQRAAELGVGDRMRFLGHRSDVAALYGAMDVLVLPSHREGFPRSPMEAAATGRPVIVSDIRGCRETVEPGRSGLLVAPRRPDLLAEAIVALLRNRELRTAMGQRGRELAEERFDQRDVFRRVADAYRELARGA